MLFKKATNGIHPRDFKDKTQERPIKKAKAPKTAVIPLSQHTGAVCEPLVKPGERVFVGTKIGVSSKFVSGWIHSSVSGTVAKVDKAPHPFLGQCPSVYIENDGKEELDPDYFKPKNPDLLNPAELRNIIREAGIVGLGGACFPTHVKLELPKDKKADTLVINGAECEPYLACDYRLMIENACELFKGISIIKKILGVKDVILVVEKNKPKAVKLLREMIKDSGVQDIKDIRVAQLATIYPQGAEKTIIKTILKKEVPSGGLPLDIGVVMQNVGTALAIYEAVELGKPLYERVVTVAGPCVREPENFKVKIGTPMKELIAQCSGLCDDPAKIIAGGPMMGIAQYADDAPVVKGTTGILLFGAKDVLDNENWQSCISCSRCTEACPIQLVPSVLSMAAEKERFDVALEYDVFDCFECGNCSYVCPSKRPMVQLIKYAKVQLLKKQRETKQVV